MERKKQVEKKSRWKKITRGTLYPFPSNRNRRVKQNEIIEATEEEIAKFRDQFELVPERNVTKGPAGRFVSPKAAEKPVTEKPARVRNKKLKDEPPVKHLNVLTEDLEEYSIVPAGNDLYDVLSPAGKKMNEESLDLKKAGLLKESLSQKTTENE
jgi:hypothetical protein